MSQNGQTSAPPAGAKDPAVDRLEALPQPIVGFARDYPAGHQIAAHRHRRAQLIHATSGVMAVRTADGAWVVPPEFALWLPAETDHAIACFGTVRMRTVYADPAIPDLPAAPVVTRVGTLLRALIMRLIEGPASWPEDSPQARLAAVLTDELRALRAEPLHLPLPRDSRARRVAQALLAAPGDERTLSGWADMAGASSRTLARHFRRETGLTFAEWRRRLRLLHALERLAAGEPVLGVALDLGYSSPSAFAAMVRRATGTSPTTLVGRP